MKRLLHLCRAAPPPGVVGPDDRVIYLAGRPDRPPDGDSLWSPTASCGRGDAALVATETLCELLFEFDNVVVW